MAERNYYDMALHRHVRKENQSPGDNEDKNEKARMELYDWLQCILIALLSAVLLFVFIGTTMSIDGVSMERTLIGGDRVILSNLFYTPNNGDIIVFHSPAERYADTPLVKRVIALEGQQVYIDFDLGNVYVNGVMLVEEYIDMLTTARHDFEGPVIVPEGHVFVLGDNRNQTIDSRSSVIGFVDDRHIIGRVLIILIPGVDRNGVRDWSRFGTII